MRGKLTPGFAAALGMCGVALAVFPPGLNPFGPAKLLAMMLFSSLACAAVAFDEAARARIRGALRSRVAWAAGALGLLSVLSLVSAGDIRLALAGAYPNYTGLLSAFAWIALAVAAAASSPGDLRRVAGRGAVLSLLVVGAYAAMQRLGIDPMSASDAFSAGRATSTLGNASNLGVFIALMLPLALDRAREETGALWRTGAGVALLLGASAAGFSGSRGAWAGIAAGLVVMIVSARRSGRALSVVAVVTVVLALSIAFTPVSASRAVGGGTGDSTARGRLAVWSATLPMIAERPFLGWGPSGFGRAHTAFMTPAEVDPRGRVEAIEDPHNLVLSVAASSGIPGALALLVIVGLCSNALLEARKRPDAGWAFVLAASLASGFVALQFHFVTLDSGAALAVLLGAVIGVEIGAESAADAGGRTVWLSWAAGFAVMAMLATGLVASDSYVRKGFAAAESGDWSSASRAFDAAQAVAPWEPAILWAAGRASTDALADGSGKDAYGSDALWAAVDAMPGDSRPLRDLGDHYIALSVAGEDGKWSSALMAYEEALALSPLDPRAWLGRGVAQAGEGDLALATDSILRSVELAPRFTDAWINLAAVYDAAGEPDAAASARERAESTP